MFKNILIPTDGSTVGNKAVKAGVELAGALGARVTGFYAIEAIQPQVYGEGYIIDRDMIADFEARAMEIGQGHMLAMKNIAVARGVSFASIVKKSPTPYEGIIDAAKENRCDAIFMASHGRRGLAGLILGSVTHKVLTHSKIPVLVYR
jgi:nucleotide-binding universal stress UspA family protein